MADKMKQSYALKLVAGFTDGDERTISIDNPRSDITAADIRALDSLARDVIIGDKYGAPFQTFKDAGIQETTTVYLDLEDTQ